ncbi:LysR family transcriptional regulator [Paracoccus sp. Z330]|uniref:LysR family transcriptional regulator n=1 Tax=Paracoccus onchidii TaxID=3017813 RepID=A0ABT4ZI80_9RHOB|nr:LysR family transcriptional regulator [Paracoccus onchidii]MDB6178703.1 LysR family transcriptional regulator [Paracoccus onchidii]
MLDRLTGMTVFSQAARLGSFSAAARTLGMSPTMATKHMNALEERLGVKLVHRSTRRITLTDAGQRYLHKVRPVLADLTAADAAATAEKVEVEGLLRISAPVSFGVKEIAPLLPELAKIYPRLHVELGASDRKVDLVAEGFDVAVRIGHNPDQTTIARKLARCRTMVVAAPSYLDAHGVPQTLADLAAHNCLGDTLSSFLDRGQWLFGDMAEIAVPVSGNMRADNGDVLVALALAGQGIIYEPSFLVGDHVRSGALVALSLDQPTVEMAGVYAAYPDTRHTTAKVRAFIDFMVRSFGSPPSWDRGLRF